MASEKSGSTVWGALDPGLRSHYRSEYERQGYIVIRQLVQGALLEKLRDQALQELGSVEDPIEFEADLGYPGAPEDRAAAGGKTPRRFLHAYDRHETFREFATDLNLLRHVRLCTNRNKVVFSPNHHNCIMTKHPGYSSSTYWHQDIRYWHFEKPELVTVWLALTHEVAENGALKVIPESHNLCSSEYELDEMSFLRPESQTNQRLMGKAEQVTLDAGDALFFHCRLFHGANQNVSKDIKLSYVLTFHTEDNQPIAGTRSTLLPEIAVE